MSGPLAGKRVLVTAGGTREPLDAVRYIGNRSSGRMGVALAAEARQRGAVVTLIASNLGVPTPEDVEVVEAPTAADLESEASARSDADVVLMAAAVSDYRPTESDAAKRPKDDRDVEITLEPTTDVLKLLGEQRANGQVLVGFAAETGTTVSSGRERSLQPNRWTSSSTTTYPMKTWASTQRTTRW